MAVSTKTYDATGFRCAIAKQTTFGTANTTQAEFYELHTPDLSFADGSDVLADDTKRSDGLRVNTYRDSFKSVAGGTSTLTVSGIATKETLALLLFGVMQDIATETDITPYLKTFEWDDATTGYTSDLPTCLLTALVYNPSTDNHQEVHSCVVKTLTLESEAGPNGGRLRFTATLFSGFPITRDSVTATPASWVAPTANFWTHQNMVTKTINPNGGGAVDLILGPVSLTFENNATRFGYTSTGDAEGYHLGMFELTGSVDVKYDANTDDLGDLWYVSPTAGTAEFNLFLGYAAAANVKELSFDIVGRLTAPEAPSGKDMGVFTTLAFAGMWDGTNEVVEVKIADEVDRGWIA